MNASVSTWTLLRVLFGALLVARVAAPGAASAQSASKRHVRGTVVAVRAPDVVLVRHVAESGMPEMTMAFRVRKSIWPLLQTGASIESTVDTRTVPWTLDAVHGSSALASLPPTRYVPPIHEGDAFTDFVFVDQRSHPVTLRGFGGSALIVSFIYTRCPDPRMCPLVSAKFARLQRAIALDRIHLLAVTLDPRYDTPRVLARYAARFAADPRRWSIVTGDPAAIADLGARVGITPAGGTGVDAHAEAVVVVDAAGRVARIIDGNDWTADQVLSEARTTLGGRPSAVARLTLWLAAGVAAACGGGRSGMSMAAALALFVTVLAALTFLIRRAFGSLFV